MFDPDWVIFYFDSNPFANIQHLLQHGSTRMRFVFEFQKSLQKKAIKMIKIVSTKFEFVNWATGCV